MPEKPYEYDRTAELAKAGFAVEVNSIPLPVQVKILEDRVKELEAQLSRLQVPKSIPC